MKSRAILFAFALLIAMPTLVAAAKPTNAGTYAAQRMSLGTDSNGGEPYALFETLVLDGTLLTSSIEAATDWRALAAQPQNKAAAQASIPVAAVAATSYKTIGRRYTAFNSIGWVVISYTIWQEFGYNGSKITYAPPPSYEHDANWGWELKNHTETAWWITNPTYRASKGTFFFKQGVWSPFGNINLSEKSSWVQVNYRHTGAWTATNGG